MTETFPFDPDWVVPTSEVLREYLDENHLSTRVAVAGYVPEDQRATAAALLDAVLNDYPVGKREARLLAKVMGTTEGFWLSFEHNYRTGLAAGKTSMGRGRNSED